MENQKIFELLYKISELKLSRQLTSKEKEQIIIEFNNFQSEEILKKCVYTLRKVTGFDFSSELLIERRSLNFSLDAIQTLLNQLKIEARIAASQRENNLGNDNQSDEDK